MRIFGMAHAYMAISVHHILAGQNTVGDHEVAHQGRDVAHEGPWVVNGRLEARFIYIKARADEIAATRLPCEESSSSHSNSGNVRGPDHRPITGPPRRRMPLYRQASLASLGAAIALVSGT